MFSLISRNIPKSLWGQTALMFIALAVVLAVLRAFTSQHYFMGAVTLLWIRNRMVRRMAGEATSALQFAAMLTSLAASAPNITCAWG